MDAEETYGGPEYGEQCAKYEGIADAISGGDTIVITGIGCSLKVWSGALVITSGKTHIPQEDRVTKLYRGVHSIRSIVVNLFVKTKKRELLRCSLLSSLLTQLNYPSLVSKWSMS